MKTIYKTQIAKFLQDATVAGEATIIKSIPGPEIEIVNSLRDMVSDGAIIPVEMGGPRLSYCLKSVREMAIKKIMPLFLNSSDYFSAEDVKKELKLEIKQRKICRVLKMLGSENLLTINKFDGKYFFRSVRFYGCSSPIVFEFNSRLNEYRKNNGLLPDKPVFEIEKLNSETGLEL